MEWKTSPGLVPYDEAVSVMEARVRAIREKQADELIWLLEHPPLYTAGTSAKAEDLLDTLGLPVYPTGRGGQHTYHGPGQRVAYVMLDLQKRGADVRAYVKRLEQWIILTLGGLGVEGFVREGRIGVWVNVPRITAARIRGGVLYDLPTPKRSRFGFAQAGDPAGEISRSEIGGSVPPVKRASPPAEHREAKIAALGIRVRQWVSYHGISLNLKPDLSHYRGIVPCGIPDYGVTSLADLGIKADMKALDKALKAAFGQVF